MRDFLLQSHGATMAFVFQLRRYLSWHFRGAGSFLPRILKNTKPLESGALNKIQQRLKFRFRFTRETDDECRTQCDSWNPRTQLCDHCFNMRAISFAPHPAKHRFIDMLQRYVDVTRDVPTPSDRRDQFVAPMRRMGVQQSNPKFAVDFFDLAQERGQCQPPRRIDRLTRTSFFGPQIHPVIGRVLADQIDLAHSFSHKRANLGEDRFRRAAAVTPAHWRDDSKTARMIAPLGDLQLRRVWSG